ncbi:MAG TPA: hypothetical protein VFS67_35505 [Polyangiaceae bacterium]|nr:hypothetical protein [Polyangiaceae bacterium]
MKFDQIKARLQTVGAELEAEQQRYQAAKDKLDARKLALIEEGRAQHRALLDGHREQAAKYLDSAAERLGPPPTPPKLEELDGHGDLDALVRAHDEYRTAVADHEKRTREIGEPLVGQLQGLNRLARKATDECSQIGLLSVGAAGRGLISFWAQKFRDGNHLLEELCRKAVGGVVTAQECRALATILRMPEPERGELVRNHHGGAEHYQPDPRADIRHRGHA